MLRLQSLLGLVVFLALCYGIGCLVARKRLTVNWRVVGFGLALQASFALLILKSRPGEWLFEKLDRLVKLLLEASKEGASLLFGSMAKQNNVPVGPPLEAGDVMGPLDTSAGLLANVGAYFAFNVLPTIIFFSALLAVLYHIGIMNRIVAGMSWVMRRTMGTSGAETLSAAANVFVGQTEAPLFVRPFLAVMTVSELFAVMTGGFSNIASGVLGVYADMLSAIPNAGGHLLAASVISAPAGLVVAKLIMPETETVKADEVAKVETHSGDANVLDAAVRGTRDGLLLAANVGAVLIVFTAGVWLANAVLAYGCDAINDGLGFVGVGGDPIPVLSIQSILGRVFQPVAWLCGIPWQHSYEVGGLIGIKTTLNEFLGYLGMSQGLANHGENYLGGPRQQLITLYALCGFANFASVGIQIGGIGVLAPSRRKELAKIGLLAMVGGTIASFLTACVVGMIV